MAKQKKENKTDRIGMRVSPAEKERWEATAKSWGYPSLAAWICAMADWAIAFDQFDGDYEAYKESLK